MIRAPVRRPLERWLQQVLPSSAWFPRACYATAVDRGATEEQEKPKEISYQRRKVLARRAAPTPKNRFKHPFDKKKEYNLPEALWHVRQSSWAGFDETVELSFRLRIDPRKADENIKGFIDLPHDIGTNRKIVAFVPEEKSQEFSEVSGADMVGSDDLISQVVLRRAKNLRGYFGAVATPEIMPEISRKAGRVLGPKKLLPNAKIGMVTPDIETAIARFKNGCRFQTDRHGIVRLVAGKLSFTDEQLVENCIALTDGILAARPESVKKKYVLAVHVCGSMTSSAKVSWETLFRATRKGIPMEPYIPTETESQGEGTETDQDSNASPEAEAHKNADAGHVDVDGPINHQTPQVSTT